MKFFNMFERTGKDEVAAIEKSRKSKGGKFFKIVNTICIIGVFVAIGIAVLGVTGILALNAVTFGVIGTIASVCIGSWLMLPWVAYLEQKKHKKLCIAFIVMDIIVPLLWIFAVWFVVIIESSGGIGIGTLTFIKVVLLISLQFSVVSIISNTVLRYGKSLLIVQIIAYISYIYFDFYISFALFCISFNESAGISFSEALSVLGNKVMLSLFVLALVYLIVAFSIIGGIYKRRRTLGDNATEMFPEDQSIRQEPVTENKVSIEEQLQALQNLLDKNLITQEEYEEKRKEIIGRM